MKAAIAIDTWKLEIFDRHLKQGGYKYESMPGLVPDSLLLKVETTNLTSLEAVVRAANDEAARTGKPKENFL